MALNLVPQKGLVTRYTQVKYEGPHSYQSEDMANVKVLEHKEMDQQMGQKLYAPDLSMWGHKKDIPLSPGQNLYWSARIC